MHSEATTVAEYLASLPADRREAITAVREVILKNLDEDYEETMQYGMISYAVSPGAFPTDFPYDPKHPLPFAALASQKEYMSVYLMGVYSDDGNEHADWFRKSWAKAGKKLDMGKACVRFTRLEDVALDVLGEAIRRIPAKRYVEIHTHAISHLGKDSSGAEAAPARPEPVAATAKPPSKKHAPSKQHGRSPSKQHAKPAAKKPAAKKPVARKPAAHKPAAKKPAAKKAAAKRR